jgi:Homeodomain-like domain
VTCAANTKAGRPCRRAPLAGEDLCAVHRGGPVGRPPALTPEIEARIVAAVSAGAHLSVAARAAGVSRQTLHRWRARGAAEPEGPYHRLAEALERAEAEAEVRQVALIARAGQTQWRAAAWLLSRRAPERWGRGAAERAVQAPASEVPSSPATERLDLRLLEDDELALLEALCQRAAARARKQAEEGD